MCLISPPLTPAKARAQIQPDGFVGFTWIPAFAGTSGFEVTA
jgi:hypothetical protein